MNKDVNNLPLPRGASAAKIRVAPTTSTPLVQRAVTPGEGGTREAQPRFAYSHQTRKMLVLPRLMRRFGGNTTPQRQGLRPLRERRCAYLDHVHLKCPFPPPEGWTPI